MPNPILPAPGGGSDGSTIYAVAKAGVTAFQIAAFLQGQGADVRLVEGDGHGGWLVTAGADPGPALAAWTPTAPPPKLRAQVESALAVNDLRTALTRLLAGIRLKDDA